MMQGDRPALVTGNGRHVEGPAPDWLDPGFMLFDSVSLAPVKDGDARRSRFLGVALAGKCGFLDASDGRWIIPLQYDHYGFGDEGKFLVGVEGYRRPGRAMAVSLTETVSWPAAGSGR